jgi:hypothetical protein
MRRHTRGFVPETTIRNWCSSFGLGARVLTRWSPISRITPASGGGRSTQWLLTACRNSRATSGHAEILHEPGSPICTSSWQLGRSDSSAAGPSTPPVFTLVLETISAMVSSLLRKMAGNEHLTFPVRFTVGARGLKVD